MVHAQLDKQYRSLKEEFSRADSLESGRVLDYANQHYRSKFVEPSRQELRDLVQKVPAEQLDELYFKAQVNEFPELERAAFRELRIKNVVDYQVLPEARYGRALQNLRDKSQNESQLYLVENGKVIPPTIEENLEMRLNDLHTERDKDGNIRESQDRIRLFKTWLDSRSGVAYKKDEDEFKIVPKSSHLINIASDFNQPYIELGDYEKIDAEPFKRSEVKCSVYSSRGDNTITRIPAKDIPDSRIHLALVGGRRDLLVDYIDGLRLAYELDCRKMPEDDIMRFWIRAHEDIEEDQLRALFVSSLDFNSDADDDYNLNNNARFARVAQDAPRSPKD